MYTEVAMSIGSTFQQPARNTTVRVAGATLIAAAHLPVGAGVACSSAAALIFEIALTRIFAVTQFYHFAFMTVSLALLGYGASGSLLTAFPRIAGGGPHRWAGFAALQSISTLGAYVLTNALPFDSFSIAWDTRQVVYLSVTYLALVVPFFFSGIVISAILAQMSLQTHPERTLSEASAEPKWESKDALAMTHASPPSTAQRKDAAPLRMLTMAIASHHTYAANLLGSGAGCLLALGGLAWLRGTGVIALAAIVAMIGALLFEVSAPHRSMSFRAIALAGIIVLTIVPLPDLQLSPYKDLSGALRYPGSQIISTKWNASSRVDHVQSAGIRSLAGLSFTFRGSPPKQDGLTFDGDDLSPIPLVEPQSAPFVPYLFTSLPFTLRPDADALILEPRGGFDVFIALANNARSITAVEPNELAIEAARHLYDDPRVHVLLDEPRAFVERSAGQFDVIDLALTAPYRPVSSGAYSLAEDYGLTIEAVEKYLAHLRPNGILTVMRWLQTPPSEETRLIALAIEALRRAELDPRRSLVALRGYSTALVLMKRGEFTGDELAAIRRFAESRRFDFIAAPDLRVDELNRYNVLPDDAYYRLAQSLLNTSDPSSIYAAYSFDIAPPTDDQPFFGHFFKWSQTPDVLAGLGKTWQPFGGAGYFVLIVLLGLSALMALVLIVAPLSLWGKQRTLPDVPPIRRRRVRWWTLAYFGLLGIGFLFVEIPIVQQVILLVGRPTIALAVVLFALLVASGLGSLSSRRLRWRATAIILTIAIALYPTLIRILTGAILFAPIEVRVIAGGLMLTPLGFLMGTMFPKGIAYLEERAPDAIPWAWAINGATSVISAIASALLALTFGFSFVIACGAMGYGLCALLVSGTKRTSPRFNAVNSPA
jgi:hypothetical protein